MTISATYDKYQRLSKAEREFVWAHPFAADNFNNNAEIAESEAKKRFSAASLYNGSGDAFRHCFWCALNARDQGKKLARLFGDAHESGSGNPEAEKAMDLHNNGVGYEIGEKSPGASNRHLAVLCAEAWALNKLVQIKTPGSGDLVYSNSTENFIYGAKD